MVTLTFVGGFLLLTSLSSIHLLSHIVVLCPCSMLVHIIYMSPRSLYVSLLSTSVCIYQSLLLSIFHLPLYVYIYLVIDPFIIYPFYNLINLIGLLCSTASATNQIQKQQRDTKIHRLLPMLFAVGLQTIEPVTGIATSYEMKTYFAWMGQLLVHLLV